VLRVAAAWGTTVLAVKNLLVGESYVLGESEGASMVMPDGLTASSVPVRAVASGWELDARGVSSGLLRLRGRDEDPIRFSDAPVVLMPGDWGLLQYGAFSLRFQCGPARPPLSAKKRKAIPFGLSIVSSVIFHFGLFGLVRALTEPSPIPKPAELSNPEEIAARFGIERSLIEEPPKETTAGNDKSGGTGVKDPGAHDTKKQGGGKKMTEAEGKLGKNGKEDHTELQGEIRNGLGGMSDVLASETGEEIKHTLGTISSVAAALGGLNSANIVLGAGSGTGLKGIGPGGGGTGPGVPFGSGTPTPGGASEAVAVSARERVVPGAKVAAALGSAETEKGTVKATVPPSVRWRCRAARDREAAACRRSRFVASSWRTSARCALVTRARPSETRTSRGASPCNGRSRQRVP
jgi:hypothetical protein